MFTSWTLKLWRRNKFLYLWTPGETQRVNKSRYRQNSCKCTVMHSELFRKCLTLQKIHAKLYRKCIVKYTWTLNLLRTTQSFSLLASVQVAGCKGCRDLLLEMYFEMRWKLILSTHIACKGQDAFFVYPGQTWQAKARVPRALKFFVHCILGNLRQSLFLWKWFLVVNLSDKVFS